MPNTYIVTPNNGAGEPYELTADNAERDPQTGYVNFTSGSGDDLVLVASVLNVSFRTKQDDPEA